MLSFFSPFACFGSIPCQLNEKIAPTTSDFVESWLSGISFSADHSRQFFVDSANSEGAKLFCEVWLNLIIPFQFGIFSPHSGEDKKKGVFATFWCSLNAEYWNFLFASLFCLLTLLNLSYGAYFQLKARIYLGCQVGITCQKIEGTRHISLLLMSELGSMTTDHDKLTVNQMTPIGREGQS